MNFAKLSICAAAVVALSLATTAAAGAIEVVSAPAEYAAAHTSPAAKASGEDFQATMDRVFGPGRWRQTSGYRTQAQENALRRQGAGAVAPGHVSYHSIGAPNAPGAYDAVVDHMPLGSAAAKLKSAGGGVARVLAEGKHGAQGPHLHVELARGAAQTAGSEAVADDKTPRAVRARRARLLIKTASVSAAAN